MSNSSNVLLGAKFFFSSLLTLFGLYLFFFFLKAVGAPLTPSPPYLMLSEITTILVSQQPASKIPHQGFYIFFSLIYGFLFCFLTWVNNFNKKTTILFNCFLCFAYIKNLLAGRFVFNARFFFTSNIFFFQGGPIV